MTISCVHLRHSITGSIAPPSGLIPSSSVAARVATRVSHAWSSLGIVLGVGILALSGCGSPDNQAAGGSPSITTTNVSSSSGSPGQVLGPYPTIPVKGSTEDGTPICNPDLSIWSPWQGGRETLMGVSVNGSTPVAFQVDWLGGSQTVRLVIPAGRHNASTVVAIPASQVKRILVSAPGSTTCLLQYRR